MPAEKRLAALKVAKIRKPGWHADGGGLYLKVTPAGTRSWVFRFRAGDRRHDMGLGAFPGVSLAEARDKAEGYRKDRKAAKNPLFARRKEKAERLSVKAAGEAYIKAHDPGWRNAKHKYQWRATLETYVHPHLGDLSVQEIETSHVMKVLEPIWTEKPETATRVRGRLEAILSWATARGYRTGANPAQWRGHLDRLLPQRAKIAKVVHHAALPFPALPAFMSELRQQDGTAARALTLTILCAGRTGEVINAKWDEFDLAAGVWAIPAHRMKAGKEHRVPLSAAAITTMEKMRAISGGSSYVFPGGRGQGKPLSNMAMMELLKRMGRGDLTVHGFRSTFKDWASETTAFPNELTEMALAHAIEDKVEAAYRRGELFEKRREVMAAWAAYCLSTEGC